jgi:hypothetical protein
MAAPSPIRSSRRPAERAAGSSHLNQAPRASVSPAAGSAAPGPRMRDGVVPRHVVPNVRARDQLAEMPRWDRHAALTSG